MDVMSNDSSIMNVTSAMHTVGPTMKPEQPDNAATGVMFWFRRSDFYVTGMDFVFARIAIVSQSNCIAFYLLEVCNFKAPDNNNDGEPDGSSYHVALAAGCSFLGSLLYSLFIQEHIQLWHQYDKYNLFLYSLAYFTVAGVMLFFLMSHSVLAMEI